MTTKDECPACGRHLNAGPHGPGFCSPSYHKVPNPQHPETAARATLAAELDAAGPSWADLADAIESGTNYENDTIHVGIALRAIMTAQRHGEEE
jgi:hypothetical protein